MYFPLINVSHAGNLHALQLLGKKHFCYTEHLMQIFLRKTILLFIFILAVI